MNRINTIQAWQNVLAKIAQAAAKAQRQPKDVQLLAVSKTFPLSAIQTLFAAGQKAFGENYAQELQMKALALPEAEWHFIGPIQSNKTKIIATHASWVHSVDRISILQRLSRHRPHNLPPLNICLQVNVSQEATKSGVSLEDLSALAYAMQYPNLRLRGLMCIPEASSDPAKLRTQFANLRHAFDLLNQAGFQLDTLSMGMSSDFDMAICEGATMVRVGAAIFGAR